MSRCSWSSVESMQSSIVCCGGFFFKPNTFNSFLFHFSGKFIRNTCLAYTQWLFSQILSFDKGLEQEFANFFSVFFFMNKNISPPL